MTATYFKPIWGILIPHLLTQPGAVCWHGGVAEYGYAVNMVQEMALDIIYEDKELGYGEAISHLMDKDINAIIEPHFNAHSVLKASGYEILVMKGDLLSEKYATEFLLEFSQMFPERRNRGVKFLKEGDRGFINLLYMKFFGAKVAMLTELFFGDNKEDWLEWQDQARFWDQALKKYK